MDSFDLDSILANLGSKRQRPNGDKQVALRKIANVSAFAPDYSQGYEKVLSDMESLLPQADLLIGTSMGGFLVSRPLSLHICLSI